MSVSEQRWWIWNSSRTAPRRLRLRTWRVVEVQLDRYGDRRREPVDEDIGMGMGMDTNMSGAKPQPFPLIGVSDIYSQSARV
jgi:hypothetical protein